MHPGRQRGQRDRLLEGLHRSAARGRGCSATRPRARRRWCTARRSRRPRRSRARSGSATRPAGRRRWTRSRARAGRSAPSPTRRSSTPTASWPREEGVFCEPASAAGVAGLLANGAEGAERIACVLTGHGLKDPQTALAQAGSVVPVRAGHRRGRARHRCIGAGWSGCRRPRPTSGRASTCSPRRSACTSSSRWRRPGASRVHTDLQIARDRRNLAVRAFETLHPADDFEFTIRSDVPLVGRARDERGGLRGRADGGRLDLRARRAAAGRRDQARGPPGQRRRGAAGRLRGLRRARGRRASTIPAGLEAILVVPHKHVRTARARAALPAAGAARRRRAQRRPREPARARARARRLGPRRARASHDRLHQPRRAAAVPAVDGARCAARRSSARSARRSPAPGRRCCSGRTTRRRAR